MAEMIAEALRRSWTNFLDNVLIFLPRVLATLSILIVGWLIAWLLSFVLRHVLRWIQFDTLADRSGITDMMKRVGLPSASILVSSTVFWVVLISIPALGDRHARLRRDGRHGGAVPRVPAPSARRRS